MKCFECPIREKCILGFFALKSGNCFVCKDIYHFTEKEKLAFLFKAFSRMLVDFVSFLEEKKDEEDN